MEHELKFETENWTELLRKENLPTTSCPRCMGLLVSDWFYDLENPGEYHVKGLRCVQCGHRIDPTIVQNRIRLKVAQNLEGRFKEEHSMNAEHWEDARTDVGSKKFLADWDAQLRKSLSV